VLDNWAPVFFLSLLSFCSFLTMWPPVERVEVVAVAICCRHGNDFTRCMQYFVTGATGFIGKRLVKKLLERKGSVVYFLLRKESAGKVAELRSYWGVSAARAVPVFGDLTSRKLGVSAEDVKKLKGQIDHFYHLAAVYDLSPTKKARWPSTSRARATRWSLPRPSTPGTFTMSAIAAAGLYEGVFREDMFDEAEGLDHPYFMTKHESEKIVRKECKVPWTVYRPAMVVGDSTTGEMDKIDGPYYFFKLIQRMRQLLPPWMPSVGLEGGRINIVPVDFVVNASTTSATRKPSARSASTWWTRWATAWATCWTSSARPRMRRKMNLFVNAALLGFIPAASRRA
jgi:thioester reductase-like protein